MPVLHAPITERRVAAGRLAIIVTVVAWLGYLVFWLVREGFGNRTATSGTLAEAIVYLVTVTLLTSSALAYLSSRLGFFYRVRNHRRAPRAVLDDFYARKMPTLTVIVPSYREDEDVIRNTLLSAALQEYPYKRIVLLIDDPPEPSSARHRRMLAAARGLPHQIEELLSVPARRFGQALEQFEVAVRTDSVPVSHDMVQLIGHYDFAVSWLADLADLADERAGHDHADAFFTEHVLRRLGRDLATTATALRAADAEGVVLPVERMAQLYRRLAWTFRAELSSFERKQYVSLSHEANKAMNLNSYVGLMGGSYREIHTPEGRALVAVPPGMSDLNVPDPDYVLTLDADSVLLPEYCARLVHLLEQSEHEQVAVAQTPYSAFPGARSRLERIAGATTDLQHIVHQGLTYYDATFWVGANAVIRKKALDDIVDVTYQGDWEIRRYVQDRTVIEDTDSTVDLVIRGWKLVNYPERLSYSATPPDFGALCIQRRRWSNGGLLILPKLRRHAKARKAAGKRASLAEILLRANYMGSIFWSATSLVMLLAYPFANELISPLLGLVALPYFAAMAADLRYCGYKRLDVLRIYGFNLVLLPVNLAGTAASLAQVLTGEKSAFGRTPKVRNRTVSPLFYLIMPYALIALAAVTFYNAYRRASWNDAVYAAVNALLASYAVVAFIGIRHTVGDLWVHTRKGLTKPASPAPSRRRRAESVPVAAPPEDWRRVLHFGGTDPSHWPVSGPATVAVRAPAGRMPRSHGAKHARSPRPEQRPEQVPEVPMLDFHTVFQPVVDLDTSLIVGYEALTRFEDGVAPDQRLAELSSARAGIDLETALAQSAVAAAGSLPAGAWVSVNASVRLARGGDFEVIGASAQRPLGIEIKEPPRGLDNAAFLQAAAAIVRTAWLIIDNAGLDYESLSLVKELKPRFLKIDRRWIAGIDIDPVRQAQVSTMASVAMDVGCSLIATGVETEAQLACLRRIGVHCGQGYLLGKPQERVDA